MMDTEAFREFKTGLTFLRDNYAVKALPHMRRAVDLDKNNPYYMSYLGVVLARSETRRRRRRSANRAEICAPRYPADDCDEQIDTPPFSRAQLPRPQEPDQPAAGNP